ncbi:hypothetical protein QFC22_005161 [Naganishia vaughanmartiniae]|uniref:Uncharacterized protein n=1 Tax=Naganishia vaughanmartiniae TaxID=1424756 RepID=A0ACC2WUF5_9TREE|nr:hypothetical protein QFC22_005161 [Naganishia vaughanmartiniae]
MAQAPVIPPRLSSPSPVGRKKAYPFMLGGIRGAYDGLTAALLRALTYSTFRFGAYEVVKTKWLAKNPSMLSMIAASAGAGGAAGLLGVPAEVVLIRMASDRTRPPAERYGYRNCVHGLYRITKDEGILALYRGVAPNVVRAILMNASQLASYDYFKSTLLKIKGTRDGPALQFGASFLAGTVATTLRSIAHPDSFPLRLTEYTADHCERRQDRGSTILLPWVDSRMGEIVPADDPHAGLPRTAAPGRRYLERR